MQAAPDQEYRRDCPRALRLSLGHRSPRADSHITAHSVKAKQKQFLETVCKTILTERKTPPGNNEDLPSLIRSTIKALPIIPAGVSGEPQLKNTIMVLLNNLGSVAHRLAELRNQSGTGHGRHSEHVGLAVRHAKLAIGAATSLAVFLYDCHEASL